MKTRILCFLILISGFINAQTTVNLRSLKTHYGAGTSGTGYSGNANSHTEFDNIIKQHFLLR
jgi:hypothetical protein